MARALGFGQVQHANRPFQAGRRQCGRQLEIGPQRRQESRNLDLMKQPFVAPGQRRPDVLPVRVSIPFRRGGDGSGVRRESDEHRR